MAIRVFTAPGGHVVKTDTVQLNIPQTKIDRFNKYLDKKLVGLTDRNPVSIPFSDIKPFLVPVKFLKDPKIRPFRDNDYSYYITEGEFYPKDKGYDDYLCLSNAKTFETKPQQTKEFQPWGDSNNVWAVKDDYDINAYWSQHYARGQRLYVFIKDLAIALIIDASVQSALLKLREKAIETAKKKIETEVRKLFDKFPGSERHVIKYIMDNYNY